MWVLAVYVAMTGVVLFSRWLDTQTWMDKFVGDQATEEAKEAAEVCAGMTAPICASGACKFGRYGCCSQSYCDAVDESLIARGIRIEKPWQHGLPFMGETGCVVPAHLRPVCALYSCHSLDLSRLPSDYKVSPSDASRFLGCHAVVKEGDPFTTELWEETKKTKGLAWPVKGDYVESFIPAEPYPKPQEVANE